MSAQPGWGGLIPGSIVCSRPGNVKARALDLPGVDEPATGHIVSLPEEKPQVLHLIFLRSGRMPQTGERREVVISEAFAVSGRLW